MTRRHELAQVSFVVPDLDVAVRGWLATGSTGPFFLMRHVTNLPVIHRGVSAPFDISIAFAQLGGIHVELVEQHSPGPSVFRDVFETGRGGLHHFCYLVDDLAAARQRYVDDGYEVAMDLEYEGTPMCYIDTWAATNTMTELVQADPGILELYQSFADAAVAWDGQDPVREL